MLDTDFIIIFWGCGLLFIVSLGYLIRACLRQRTNAKQLSEGHETEMTKSDTEKILKKIFGKIPQISKMKDLISSIQKIIDTLPWNPDDVDEDIVQAVLYLMNHMQADEDFFMKIADKIGGKDWIRNDALGYGKTFIHTDKNIKVGLYRWDALCIAPIHDHGKRTVAFYKSMGPHSKLMNKVYEKLGDGNDGIEKVYDEILTPENSVSVLRQKHAHAIQNLSKRASYTIHVYIPSYDFGLTWNYHERDSVRSLPSITLVGSQSSWQRVKSDSLAVTPESSYQDPDIVHRMMNAYRTCSSFSRTPLIHLRSSQSLFE